jgi:hypothetical protein
VEPAKGGPDADFGGESLTPPSSRQESVTEDFLYSSVGLYGKADLMHTPARARVLIVEPDPAVVRAIERSCADVAEVTACPRFADARAQVRAAPPDVLVTNLRLEEYNGLHLVMLVVESGAATRCVVHTDRPDLYLAREGQLLGAFFEQTERLRLCLPSYLRAALPVSDRRDPACYDRRTPTRGGRRAADATVAVVGQ